MCFPSDASSTASNGAQPSELIAMDGRRVLLYSQHQKSPSLKRKLLPYWVIALLEWQARTTMQALSTLVR